MDSRKERFRDRLVRSEQITPALRERYQREMGGMMEKKLNLISRAVIVFALILSIAFIGHFLYLLFATDVPGFAKAGFGIGALFSAAWLVLILNILRKGSMNVRTDSNAMAGLTWVFVVFLIVLLMLIGGRMEDQARGISVVLNGMVFLIGGAVSLLGNNVNQEDLRTREELLNVKYRLVDLTENLEKTAPHLIRSIPSESDGSSVSEPTRREISAIYDKKLSKIRKLGIIALIPIMLMQTAAFTYAIIIGRELPFLAKAAFGLGIVFSLIFAIILARVAIRGRTNIKTDPNIITGITWVFLVFMITILMMLSGQLSDPLKGISMVLNGLVFVMFGVVFLLQNIIHQASLRTREKLQEIGSQLTALTEALAKK